MTKSRNILSPRRFWTEAEVALLREHYPDRTGNAVAIMLGRPVKAIYQKAKELGLRKSEAFFASDLSGRVQRGKQDPRMRATQITPGTVPWNKGLKGVVGVQEACRATQFKKGRPAEESRNYKPIGSLRITRDGILERKVTDDPSIYPARRWTSVARLVWEKANGPIPAGHLVRFKHGMATVQVDEITVDRIECVSRAEHMRTHTYHQYGPELASVVQLRGAITRQINKRVKEAA